MIAELKRRALNLLIALDQFVFVVITLGHADPDWTISARAFTWERDGKPMGFMRPVIDWMFSPISDNHCFESYLREVSHAPQ